MYHVKVSCYSGLPGVQIGSHINDWNLDAPELLPIFKVRRASLDNKIYEEFVVVITMAIMSTIYIMKIACLSVCLCV
jgi:hypothetical protein